MQTANTTNEAIAILKFQVEQGTNVDSYTYVDVLKRCLQEKDLRVAREVHYCIIKSRMEQDKYVASNLLSVYIRCGSLQDARQVFDALAKKSVIHWNVMIGGYVQHNRGKDAMQLFHQMRQEHVQADKITYVSILKACASPLSLKCGREVHVLIRRDGLESDIRVGTALIQMYAKCGSIEEARQAFDNLTNRNVVSWTATVGAHAQSGSIGSTKLGDIVTWTVMIGAYAGSGRGVEAYDLYLKMKEEGFQPDAVTYVSLLNDCASTGALEWVKDVHRHILEGGYESDVRVGNALVHMYAKSGSIEDAAVVFDRMKERDVITWNVMIGAYAGNGRGVEAYDLYLKMKEEGFQPDAVTYVSLLNDCASTGALEWVKDVHRHILEGGYESDVRVGSALVHMYAKSGSIEDARMVFDRMKERDVITWNVMIGAYAKSGSIEDARMVFDRMMERDVITWTVMIGAYAGSGWGVEAYDLYLKMKEEGFQPNAATYVSLLNDCGSAGALEWVKDVHRHILEEGHESDVRVGSALVHVYAKSGSIEDAQLVFESMEDCNVMTWNIMIGGLGQHGRGRDALELFRKMKADGLVPDAYSFVALLSACSHAGLVDEGRQIFCAMKDYGVEPTVVHYTCMVDLLGRAGLLEETKRFISSMPVEADAGTWGALLGACRTYGNVELGELAAKEFIKLDPADASPYVLLSNIYAAAGQWDQVSFIRHMMQERGIRKEPGVSWIEIRNKVHRFVVGDRSHPEAKKIYDVLNNLSKKLKAEGYIPDTRLVLRNIDEEQKVHALCAHSEKLAIAYGLMHTPRGMPIRVYKNLRVCSDCHTATGFISKVTGREIVTRDANRFHHFKDGVCSCGDYW